MLTRSLGMSLLGILILSIALFSNKALAFEPSIDFNAPDWVEERESADNDVPELPKAGSLFGSGDRPLFSDRRAMKPDDLITIVINENANANFTTNKNYNGASGGNVTPPAIEYTGNNEEQKQIVQELNDQAAYNLTKANNTSNFQGGGAQTRNEALNATLTARIIKVLDNNTYFIHGRREVLVDGEKQILELSGVVRSFDISKDNVVQSKHIANAKIAYTSAGPISDTNRKKPISDGIESLYPF
ncbi:flagellar basal body L-ring protein [Helicobacter cinaedi CCUG 18818 = ATCC BAA-847]|uniref:Flagellar L-ring protein n=3 Tax=Helicobacter cinaedi TaxID=213 RepID=A0AAI8MQN2_9HELI|nr:flagellar L-ring protein FlgH [Helicobacter cinaedi CCUG 18818 = ATCC BAA-847]BAM33277.1 flagellar basal body L-ring protein [Helicobacter cinaedi CCUG 18818 = ATCC BAA-847]BDB66034.1 flagellar L-ring protein [Helicobacter cinaedi]STP11585.1 flagellar basal body L-ring protein [Helicobacter cinaedi]STP13472.1 flagellar basal body L-ring protein [Helicobacter cinaedi]